MDGKSILDKIVAESPQVAPPSIINTRHVPLKVSCKHGHKLLTRDQYEIIMSLPGPLYNDLVSKLEPNECFAIKYKDKIEEWTRDKVACGGLCWKFVVRGISYYYDGHYWCEQCNRRNQI